jgi:TonB family protein
MSYESRLKISEAPLVLGALLASAFFLFGTPVAGQSQGAISVVVADSSGIPLLGAEVTLAGSQLKGFTDEKGAFLFGGVPLGTHVLSARRLGFAPSQVSVELSDASSASVSIRLKPLVATLAPVVVRPTRVNYAGRLKGYYERLEKKTAGVFITREQIDRENPRMLGQLLQHVPGITATTRRGGVTNIRMRGRTCWPLVWVDGTAMPSGDVDIDTFSPSSIHGIEIYLGSTTAPARYTYNRDISSCGTILIWSRGPDTDPISRPPTPTVDLEQLVAKLAVYNADQVDRRAQLDSTRLLSLGFPPALYAAGVKGLVVAEFVVDTAGQVENGTLGIVSSTAAPFTEAVRVALESAAYVPAIKDGRRVRQLVQQPFEFAVDRQGKGR